MARLDFDNLLVSVGVENDESFDSPLKSSLFVNVEFSDSLSRLVFMAVRLLSPDFGFFDRRDLGVETDAGTG